MKQCIHGNPTEPAPLVLYSDSTTRGIHVAFFPYGARVSSISAMLISVGQCGNSW